VDAEASTYLTRAGLKARRVKIDDSRHSRAANLIMKIARAKAQIHICPYSPD